MPALSEQPDSIKVIHQYGVGLHSDLRNADVNHPRWQQEQVDDFVDFAVRAEEVGFDGISVTEHHVPSMTCPSPHLLIAAAAMRTSTIRLGTAVTTLTLYNPVRVAEEAGTLDLLSGGRFELGIGKGTLAEAGLTIGRTLMEDEFNSLWLEDLRILELALTERDFTFKGEFWSIPVPHTISTRPLQNPFPIWVAGASPITMAEAGRRGWNIMRNFGSNDDHRNALENYVRVGAEHGHTLSGSNFQVERFIALGKNEQQAEENLGRLADTFGRFLSIFTARGRSIPTLDAEFHMLNDKTKRRPAIAVMGTPDQIIESLRETIDETGSRRLMVEMFSREEFELFAKEVLPALKTLAPATQV